MKHEQLRSIAHNIADSLASGTGLLIGVYEMDIFGEAAKSAEGFITVDFLKAATTGGTPSPSLARAIKLYSEAVPGLCEKQGGPAAPFRKFTARYSADALERYVLIMIEDENGRCSTDEYAGIPLKRTKVLDEIGRIRTKRKADDKSTI